MPQISRRCFIDASTGRTTLPFLLACCFCANTALADPTVLVEIFEKIDAKSPWEISSDAATSFRQSVFAWNELPRKYVRGGLIADRSNPFVLRATAKLTIPEGRYQLLVRAKSQARLTIDGAVAVNQEALLKRNADGHEETPELLPPIRPGHRPPPPAHREVTASIELGGEQTFVFETVVGGKGLRAELGEACVAIASEADEFFLLLSPDPTEAIPLTEEGWQAWNRQSRDRIFELETEHRRAAAAIEQDYWSRRHDLAREWLGKQPAVAIPQVRGHELVANDIDRFIVARCEERALKLQPVCDDLDFLRRVTLDTVGMVPSYSEIQAYLADGPNRRERAIDRLLEDPRWADHWVPYWQDVLAENPNILKASLNNTGPFRWWIYESFLDNKALDRFATELILMRGSKYSGGPAGFEMATQNDVPEANKALILTQAFLAANLNCARCHDSPINEFSQKQLFSVAAMLHRKALELPKTSSVDLEGATRLPAIEVSLKPGTQVLPQWMLHELASDELPSGVMRDASDPREWLAAIITGPTNIRFAKVMANRIWQRYTGRALVEPVEDWHDASNSHPELLQYLAQELMLHNYDVKHLARLILSSQSYQRKVASDSESAQWYASSVTRRMSAEQLFDSLFAVVGKDVHAERLTMDPEGRRPVTSFLNLGVPRRAWQFSSLSNERDRPALSLPIAQSVNDLLKAFGWREARQDAVSVRDETTTALQPLELANGIVGRRLVTLSDDHVVTALSLYDISLDEMIDKLFQSFYTRLPTDSERQVVADVIGPGYTERVISDALPVKDAFAWQRHPVSWSNHLHAKSSQIMLQLEKRAREGDPPTRRLQEDWRRRMEDVLWALMNNPEFVFVQ